MYECSSSKYAFAEGNERLATSNVPNPALRPCKSNHKFQKIKLCINEATAMQDKANQLVEEEHLCTRNELLQNKIKDVTIVDYCQNLEIPLFQSAQPASTHYFTPITINCFGIADCNKDKKN